MNDITYNYEIISVDEVSRSMIVLYTSETYGTMQVGARLPFEGETLEQVIAMFSPVAEWRVRDIPVVVPQVGAGGQLTDAAPQEPESEPVMWSDEDQAAFDAAAGV